MIKMRYMSKKILLIPAVLAVGVVSALTVQEAEKFAVAKNTANSKIITFEEPEFKRKFKPGFSVVKEGEVKIKRSSSTAESSFLSS